MKLKYLLFIFTFIVFFNTVSADTNGIWHLTKDIRGGIFGLDEMGVTTNYTFIHPVYFNETLFSRNIFNSNNVIVDGRVGIKTKNPLAELDVNGTISSKNIYQNGTLVATVKDLENFTTYDTVKDLVEVTDLDPVLMALGAPTYINYADGCLAGDTPIAWRRVSNSCSGVRTCSWVRSSTSCGSSCTVSSTDNTWFGTRLAPFSCTYRIGSCSMGRCLSGSTGTCYSRYYTLCLSKSVTLDMTPVTRTFSYSNHFGSGYNQATHCETYTASPKVLAIKDYKFSLCQMENHGWYNAACSVSTTSTNDIKVCATGSSGSDGYKWNVNVEYYPR